MRETLHCRPGYGVPANGGAAGLVHQAASISSTGSLIKAQPFPVLGGVGRYKKRLRVYEYCSLPGLEADKLRRMKLHRGLPGPP